MLSNLAEILHSSATLRQEISKQLKFQLFDSKNQGNYVFSEGLEDTSLIIKFFKKFNFQLFLQVMKAAAMSHRMIEFPVSSGNSHRVKEADVKEVIEPIPDTKPKYLEIEKIEKEDFTGMKKFEIYKAYTC